MGIYLNPSNAEFARIIECDYVDKTGLISLINQRINTVKSLLCISRPRRFGKSYAAKMLCAYYDHTCDSHALFEKYEISKDASYEQHINKYHVIYLDVAGFLSDLKRRKCTVQNVANEIAETIQKEVIADCPEVSDSLRISDCLVRYVQLTGRKIVFILDEWDAVIRETEDGSQAQTAYLNLLREWFKNGNFTGKVVASAYMTGILPIKKDGSQSAISDFREFSILNPAMFAKYTGFTEPEVKMLCKHYGMNFAEAKKWYDGYSFTQCGSVYNPFSVMTAMDSGEFDSYWKQTSAAENLITYIDINIKNEKSDLQSKILKLIAGERLEVDVSGFNNDFQTFNSDDDVLTLLVHLGYLAYDKTSKRVRIPNEEVRMEFDKLLKKEKHTKLADLILRSEKLLSDTLSGNEKAVAEAIRQIRETNYAPTHYNNEQSLRYVVKFAYIVCVDRYLKVEELPSGKGLADVVYLPKSDTALPAMIVELKWNENAETAIEQIKDRNYPAVLKDYVGEIILVGINYDAKTNEHTCKIERIQK